MWVFAFGSLMADGWEKDFVCKSRQAAKLVGYSRSFAKRSVVNWGTKTHPGLTLVLEKADGASCHGFAYEFENFGEELRTYLRKREACDPTQLALVLADGTEVEGHAYVYKGANLLSPNTSLAEKVDIVLASQRGTSGTGVDYVRNAYRDLENAGIDDPVVTALWEAVRGHN